MSGFWSSLFGGANSTLNSAIPKFGQTAGFATGLGEKNIGQASQFWSSILSGDQSKQAKALAPEISAIQGQKQQQLNSTAQFSNRSGGNNASNQMASDKARSSFNDMISSLLGSSASNLASTGGSLLNTGLSALGNQVDASQLQMKNWSDSILGLGVTKAAGFAEGFGLGKI